MPKQPIDVAYDRYWMYGLCMPVLSPPVTEEDKSLERTIASRIRDTWVRRLGSGRRDLSCTIEIQLLSNGEVVADSVRLVRSSGDPAYDRSVVAAVYKASPLPVPAGPLFERFRKLRLEFKPGSR